MNTFKLVISSPDGNLFEGEVLRLILRGADGDLAIMAGHIPFMTTVKEGKCKLLLENDEEKTGYILSGLLTVSKDCVTLLSGTFKFD